MPISLLDEKESRLPLSLSTRHILLAESSLKHPVVRLMPSLFFKHKRLFAPHGTGVSFAHLRNRVIVA